MFRPQRIVLIVLAVVGGLIFFSFMPTKPSQSTVRLYCVLYALVIVGVWMMLESHSRLRFRSDVRSKLASLGFTQATREPRFTPEHRALLWSRVECHSFEVNVCMRADWHGREVFATEFQYERGYGRSNRTYTYLQVAADTHSALPDFRLRPAKGRLDRPLLQVLSNDADDPQMLGTMSKRYELVCDSSETVRNLLPPDLRDWLADAPKQETWRVDQGVLSCTWRGPNTVEQVEPMLIRLGTFLKMLS